MTTPGRNERLRIPPISPAAEGPLYQQIVEGVKREIGESRLLPGQSLPSFRALAEELLVSVITVKRAYEELEREGIIYRRQGLGTFVSPDGFILTCESKRAQAEDLMRCAVNRAAEAGMGEEEVEDLLRRALKGYVERVVE
jgi:GntR family transcriptional regulator